MAGKQDVEQNLLKVLGRTDCPEDLAKDAARICGKYYPDRCLIGASDEEVRVVKEAQKYVRDDD